MTGYIFVAHDEEETVKFLQGQVRFAVHLQGTTAKRNRPHIHQTTQFQTDQISISHIPFRLKGLCML